MFPIKKTLRGVAEKIICLKWRRRSRTLILTVSSVFTLMAVLVSCGRNHSSGDSISRYFITDTGVQTGGVKIISVKSPKGLFHIWTKRIGNNPRIKVLLLTGGPGASHEYMECFESFFPNEGIEFIYYDQLGTGNSDVPKDSSVYNLGRSVDEVEQVRKALKLNQDNFYLYGHSWGGIVAIEYALKYQRNLKALIISNMMSSAADYNSYANHVLAKQINPKALSEIRLLERNHDFNNPRYMELLMSHFYSKFICRLAEWPEPLTRSFGKLNQTFYTTMQGPSEFGLSGKLSNWDRKEALCKITVPTLTIGSRYDTMDPKHMEWMSGQVKNGSFLYCSKGSHMSVYDDQKTYFTGLIKYIRTVDSGDNRVK